MMSSTVRGCPAEASVADTYNFEFFTSNFVGGGQNLKIASGPGPLAGLGPVAEAWGLRGRGPGLRPGPAPAGADSDRALPVWPGRRRAGAALRLD
jgi:hypothetical protein